ncbi:MAG: DHH family phosphoesterase [Bacillus subtilis]|nr:DHH family phosphoesterase [Bacillus subtilis]
MQEINKLEEINKLIEAIKQAKNTIIISHVGPDGDTLSSMLALREILSQFKTMRKIDALILGRIPDVYKFLPDINKTKTLNNQDLYQNYDLAISVDWRSTDRLGDAFEIFKNAKISVNIDHHISNNNFGNINIVDPQASSTGQVIFTLLNL